MTWVSIVEDCGPVAAARPDERLGPPERTVSLLLVCCRTGVATVPVLAIWSPVIRAWRLEGLGRFVKVNDPTIRTVWLSDV